MKFFPASGTMLDILVNRQRRSMDLHQPKFFFFFDVITLAQEEDNVKGLWLLPLSATFNRTKSLNCENYFLRITQKSYFKKMSEI